MSFAQFSRQTQVVQLLQRSLEQGRLSHAYLFNGPHLDELEAVARALAKTLNCQNPKIRPGAKFPTDSCDACSSCRRIDQDNHPDVQSVRPESKSRIITIEQVRELMQVINLKPSESAWKVSILADADRLNVQAANAFLKTLEEPPPRSVILLLSTDPERMLETILSRCLRLSFSGENRPRLTEAQIQFLQEFSTIAAKGEKSLLSRYQLLGSLLAQLNAIKEDSEKTVTARSPLERYDDIEPRLREKWEDELAAAIEADYRRRRFDILLTIQWWLRDVWLQVLALGDELLTFPELAASAKIVAARISSTDALGNIEVVERTQRSLNSNVQEALALEVGLLNLRL